MKNSAKRGNLRNMECGASVPLFSGQPWQPATRSPKCAKQDSAIAKTGKRAKAKTSYASMFESIKGLAGSLRALNHQAVKEYAPVVEAILRSNSRDINHIEHTLDSLLSFCGHEPALQLYRKLCRHYFYIDPAATASYVNAYREMWDEQEKEKKPRGKKGGAR